MMTNLRDQLMRAVSSEGRPSSDYDLNADAGSPGTPLRDAAVLVPIVTKSTGAPSVILTKRSSALKHHPGQIAFPGGKVDESDSDLTAAALREGQEEIALEPAKVEVLGQLAPHETVTGFNVTPVLALISPDFVPKADPREVAEVFEVPLAHFLDRDNYLTESRLWRGQRRYFFTVPWGPYYVWGATARMLRALADRMDEND